MAVSDAYVFLGFLTPVLTQLFFPKPPTTFLTCFCRGEKWKYSRKKSRLNWGSNSQPPGHESDTLTTKAPGRGGIIWTNLVEVHKECYIQNIKALGHPVSEKKNYKVFVLYSCVQLVTPSVGPVLTPGAFYEQTWYRSTRRCHIQNIKSLRLPVQRRRISKTGFFIPKF